MTRALSAILIGLALLQSGAAHGEEARSAGDAAPTATTAKAVADGLRRGTDWLLRQQAADGGWHSATYGLMKSGAGNTALALAALTAQEPEDEERRRAIKRGIAFLSGTFDDRGLVRTPDGSSDFPIYATALLLTALNRHPAAARAELRSPLREALIRAQRTEGTGWTASDPDHGGWGHTVFKHESDRSDPSTVSLTAHVLETLQESGPVPAELRTAAARFLSRCQVPRDVPEFRGGFAFTPHADDPLNKGGLFNRNGVRIPRPYFSATCDGWIGLSACGAADEAALAAGAIEVLGESFASESSTTQPAPLFYYTAARGAAVWRHVGGPDERPARERLLARLIERQSSSGAWRNSANSMREDDPLIATSFALQALVDLTTPRSVPRPDRIDHR